MWSPWKQSTFFYLQQEWDKLQINTCRIKLTPPGCQGRAPLLAEEQWPTGLLSWAGCKLQASPARTDITLSLRQRLSLLNMWIRHDYLKSSIKYSRLTRRKCTTSPRQNASMGFTEFCTATKCQARRGTLEGSICRTESTGGICGLRGRTSHFQDTHHSSAAPRWHCRVHTQAAKQRPGLQAPEQWLVLLGPATGFRGNVCLLAKQWASQNKTCVPAVCCRSSCTWIDEIWQPTACQQPCVSVLPT